MKLSDSVSELGFKLGLNVGEVLLYQKGSYSGNVEHVLGSLDRGGLRGVVRTADRRENFVPLSIGELRAFYAEQFQEDQETVLFKYPKNNELLMHGYCTPVEYCNIYEFTGMNGSFRVYWPSDLDTREFLSNFKAHRMVINKINSLLVQKKSDLLGVEIEWSIFEKGAGTRGEQVVFWGFRGGGDGNT